MTARSFTLLAIAAANPFDNHSAAEKYQQYKGYPVVPLEHELAGEHPHSPPEQRSERFDSAKDETGAQGFGKFRFMESRAFTNRGREGVHGHAEGKKNCSGYIHESVLTGDNPYDTSPPPVKIRSPS